MATNQKRDLSPLRQPTKQAPERDRSPSPQPTRKLLTDILAEWMGDDIGSIFVRHGLIVDIRWNAYGTALAAWLSQHSVDWDNMSYADVLGFFIHIGLKNQYGSYEAQILLSRITCLRQSCNETQICSHFDRLNQLNIFDGIRPQSARSFINKLARYTSCGTDWLLRDNGRRDSHNSLFSLYRVRHHSLDEPIDAQLELYLPQHPDPRFLLQLNQS